MQCRQEIVGNDSMDNKKWNLVFYFSTRSGFTSVAAKFIYVLLHDIHTHHSKARDFSDSFTYPRVHWGEFSSTMAFAEDVTPINFQSSESGQLTENFGHI